MNDDRSVPVTTPDEGYQLCYECGGNRLCRTCEGKGLLSDGEECYHCGRAGICIVCNGDGQFPKETKAGSDP